MNALAPKALRSATDETLDYLHEGIRSLKATIAESRRAVETSRTLMKQAADRAIPRSTRDIERAIASPVSLRRGTTPRR